MHPRIVLLVVAVGACRGAEAPPALVDAALMDAAADATGLDAPVDAPTLDAAPDGPDLDAAIDAPVDTGLDAPTDATPVDGAPIIALPLLTPDPAFSDDGVETLAGISDATALATSGARIGLCGIYWVWDEGQLFPSGMFAYRTTPGANQTVSASALAAPPAMQYPRGCQQHALYPDGQGAFVVDAGSPHTATYLMRRDGAGALTTPHPAPQLGVARAMHPLASHGAVVVYDDAAWVLDPALDPVPTIGIGGRIPLAGPVIRTLLRAGERLDVVTAATVTRVDLGTGALDATYGVAGVVGLPGPALTIRGAVPLPDGSTLVVGVGAGVVISPTGLATRVTLPAIDAEVVVEDRTGGAYLITTGPMYMSTQVYLTQIGPSTPTSWVAGSVTTVQPDNLGGFLDSAQAVAAAWTTDDRLAVTTRLTHLWVSDFLYTRKTGLLVLRP